MKNLILSLSLMFVALVVSNAQNYDIRFNRTSVNCQTRQVCYDVQLRPNGASLFNLAGQNYRIYYNSALASYVSGTTLLPGQYGGYTLVQDVQDANADATNGPLSFEATLGFLNYNMDLNDTQNGGIVLPAGQWTTTSNLCFIVEPAVIDNPNTCLEMVWGREGLTDLYGTAFVEVSRWVSTNNTTNSVGVVYDDLDSADGDGACFDVACAVSSISVADVSVNENGGSVTMQVCLSSAATQNVAVTLNTSNGTAIAPGDYTTISNTIVTIPAGQTCTPVTIPIIDDAVSEGNETFTVTLTNPSANAVLGDGTAIVTIIDNEGLPTLSIESKNVNENDGTVGLTVTLSAISNMDVTFTVNTSNGSATAGSDYTTILNQIYTIPAGQTTVAINIPILDDTIVEGTETFTTVLTLPSANASIGQGTSTVTILDNEVACAAQAPVISGN